MSDRFEVRANHPAWGTTYTSGRISAEDVGANGQECARTGYLKITVVDHSTGVEEAFDDWVARQRAPTSS